MKNKNLWLGIRMAAYYVGIKAPTGHHYVDDYACRSALTHQVFMIWHGQYDSTVEYIVHK